jgi:L-lactate dehydrogenase
VNISDASISDAGISDAGISDAGISYAGAELVSCASTLFERAGLEAEIAHVVAEVLVEAELLGYDTHGLQFVPAYLSAIEAGRTRTSGQPEVLRDEGAALVLDGRYLPGQWVVRRALAMGLERLGDHPMVSLAICRSQNISCLATYVKRAADQGALAILAASAPDNAVVAPHGGREPRLSTNPLAIAIPTAEHPILIDTSTSSVTNRFIERTRRAGARLPEPWLVDAAGMLSDDPEAIYADPPGAILPAGGRMQGHKGFALSILVEALTSGLAGAGRATPETAGGNHLFLLLIDPEAFGGSASFQREIGHLARVCREVKPIDPDQPVRMPGDRAHARMAEQQASGVRLHPETLQRLLPWLDKYGLAPPRPLS